MIMCITKDKFNKIIDKEIDYKYDWFICYDSGMWVACDNSQGDMWVEEFNSLDNACKWLKGEFEL